MIALVDVDGVLADFVGATLDIIEAEFGERFDRSVVTKWNLFECFDVAGRHPKEYSRVCSRYFEKPGFAQTGLRPIVESVVGFKKLRTVAEDVYIVSAPWITSTTWTYYRTLWLKQNFDIDADHIVYTSSKHVVAGDVLIDDNANFIDNWSRSNSSSLGLLWDASYNRTYTSTDRIKRVFCWDDVVKEISEYRKR